MGEGIKLGGGAGGVINAVIDEFLSVEGEISANSFVEFVTQTAVGTAVQCTSYKTSNTKIRGCVLSDTKAFLLILTEDNAYANAVVLNISNTSITVGSPVSVGDKYPIDCVAIDENRVFIAYDNASGQRSVRILSINGTSITAGTALVVDVSGDSPNGFILVAMPNDYVYLVVSDVLKGIQGVLFKVSGTTITVSHGTHTVGRNTSGSGAPCAATRLDDTRIFVYYVYWNGSNSGSTNDRQRGVVVTIANGAVSVGAVTELSNHYYYVAGVSACKVSDNKVMCVFDDPNTNKNVQAFIVNVSGSTLSVGPRYTIASISSSSLGIGRFAVRLRDGICAIAVGPNKVIYFVSVVGTEIEIISTVSFSNAIRYGNIDVTSDGKIIVFSSTTNAKAQIVKYINGIRPSDTQINGMTRTRATTAKPGKVWVLP